MRRATACAVGGAVLAIVSSGCANDRTLTQATLEYVSRAEASIERAEQAGAQRYSARELNLARQELDDARDAQERDDPVLAERLAIQADLDAQLAAARAGNEEMQAAARELDDSLRTLEEETLRSER